MDVLEKALEGKAYLCGDDYTIADIIHYKWTSNLLANEFLTGKDSYPNLERWSKAISERPAVKRGARVLGWGEGAIAERHSRADLE